MKLPMFILFMGCIVLAVAITEEEMEGLVEEVEDLETELEELEFEMEKRDQDDEDEDLEAEAEDLQVLNMMEKRKDMHKSCMDSCKKKGKTPKNMCWKEGKKWKGITRVGK
ncbi:uncharacterized protein LOC118432339 [Branchiostoma floridae]|uniref:Uncharacterized protein LOC118432339 n=1 Tax=Branchiostoma floridae TaxID=7739 RepID=A0A9J7MFE7_BRAFL|nr:uncharacterized protein LOC118432339 [Branchiostoma floridae]